MRVAHPPLFEPKAPGIPRVRDWTVRECQLERAKRGRVQLVDVRQRTLTPEEKWARAVAIAAAFEELTHFSEQVTSKVGAPRAVPWAAVVVMFLYAFLANPRDGRMTTMTDTIRGVEHKLVEIGCHFMPLTKGDVTPKGWRAHQKRGGFDYSHVESALADLQRLLEPEDSPHRRDALTRGKRWRQGPINMTQFSTAMLQASVAVFPDTDEFALDATHLLTFGRPRYEAEADLRKLENRAARRISSRPRKGSKMTKEKGHDGRPRTSTDLDARLGHFTNTKDKREGADIGVGFALELMVPIARMGQDNIPLIATAFSFRPMGATNVDDLTDMIDEHRMCHDVKVIALDRGYTNDDAIYIELLVRDIQKSQDLIDHQHRIHPAEDTVGYWHRGDLYTRGTPLPKRGLAPISKNLDFLGRVEIALDYECAHLFRFTPKSSIFERDGRYFQDFRGPAVRGAVWCVNSAELRPNDASIPQTTCQPGDDCECGTDGVRVEWPKSQLKARQRSPYGGLKWSGDYFRRNAVESYNSLIKDLEIPIVTGYTRVFGLIKNAILLTFALVAVNVISQRNWYHKRLQQDPWAALTGEEPQYFHPHLESLRKLSHDSEALHRRLRRATG